MENASKALLIAAGILIGLVILSLIVVGYRQISNYYLTRDRNILVQQLSEFNKQYISYNRDNVRGSDLLSLVNKIIDYNISSDEEKIEISIIIPTILEQPNSKNFYYNYDRYYERANKLIEFGNTKKYTQDNINNRLISKANSIELEYNQGMATKLAANISTLMNENTRKEPEDLLNELKINVDDDELEDLQEHILEYYQYQQFKRAHFNCESLIFNQNGRVKSFNFKFNGKFE